MPTIATINGYRVVIYTADHRPAHVHVIGAGFEIVFNSTARTDRWTSGTSPGRFRTGRYIS
jgi:hypothetical protein